MPVEAPYFFRHAVWQVVIVHKTAPSEFFFQGAKNVEVGGC